MDYMVIYFSIGIAVSLILAIMRKRRGLQSDDSEEKIFMADVFLFIALAWPITVAALVYGMFSRVLSGVIHGSSSL